MFMIFIPLSCNRYLFWTCSGSTPKIERSFLTGQSRDTIIKSYLQRPLGIVADTKESRIYWLDQARNLIESAKYDSRDRRAYSAQVNANLFAVTLFEVRHWSSLILLSIIFSM